MKRNVLAVLLLSLLSIQFLNAQDAEPYRTPPQVLIDLLLTNPTPTIQIDSKGEWMLLTERNSYPTVEELGQPELRVAGLRLNPNNFGPSTGRQSFINSFRLKNIKTNQFYSVSGLPENLLAGMFTRNPSETKIGFTHTTGTRIDIYVVDLATMTATRINQQPLNAVMGAPFVWLDDETILYKSAIYPASSAPKRSITPEGPTVQQNLGKAAPSRTYQDLIKSPFDERLFEFYATSQLIKNKNGKEEKFGAPAIYSRVSVSPDRQYVLTETVRKPFSYLVSASGFPTQLSISDTKGNVIKVLAELPSTEGSPTGFDNLQNRPRGFSWRDDEPSTIVWSHPLDSGMISKQVEYRDVVYALSAPFTGEPKELFRTKMRFRSITWGNKTFALFSEGLTGKQLTRLNKLNPKTGEIEMILERNTTDSYNNPGNPVTVKNKYGKDVILVLDKGRKILMNNINGSTPKGDYPYLSKFDLKTKKNEIIWRCQEGKFETVTDVIDPVNLTLIIKRESPTEPSNYYLVNLKKRIAEIPLTDFTNPYPALEGITKEKIRYKREDGIDLSGTLYLPKGYDKDKDGPLPVLIWAYPREFRSADDAAQVRGSAYHFTTLGWSGPIFWVTQGYAILDNADMPIVAAGPDKKPNDNFLDQLRMNAEAAINKLAEMGVGDKNRVAIGGHSYGAFMTANLLATTNLFKAGIARSGAYNRTLTPFGFQNEDRTYWQAPQLYYEMSPFSYANKIKTPLLLIHGDSDENPGTFPINSERLFNAIKGHGGIVRYVSLPYEGHSYRGKENLLHMLWEQHTWLEKYVKGAK